MNRLILITIVITCLSACSRHDSEPTSAIDKGLASDSNMVIDLHEPFDFPLVLAGNFGELRPYHFHGGLDFKTQGVTGKQIHCAADGYVSGVEVSPWGYGRAIFVTHPEIGLITVYGHLEAFADKIAKKVEAEQIKRQSFAVELEFPPGDIIVKRGEIIGRSGNAGSSAGPHLHMEVREISTGNAIDPLQFFDDRIIDTTPPEFRSLSLIPLDGATIDGKGGTTARREKGELSRPFTAWGRVVPAIEAFDRMNNTSNIFGVKHLSLKVDSIEIYRRTIDHFRFASNRAINSLIHFPDYHDKKRWTMTTYDPPSHPLSDIVSTNSFKGVLYILEERAYHCEFCLVDHYGNTLTVPFIVEGKKSPYHHSDKKGELVNQGSITTLIIPEAKVAIMPFTLFEPHHLTLTASTDPRFLSPVISVGDPHIAVDQPFIIAINLPPNVNQRQLCLVRTTDTGTTAIESRIVAGHIVAECGRFGKYAVTADTIPPSISDFSGVVAADNDTSTNAPRQLRLRIADNLSGIASHKCFIDNRFAIFDYDGKNATISCRLTTRIAARGKRHTLKVVVTDVAGNKRETSYNFTW